MFFPVIAALAIQLPALAGVEIELPPAGHSDSTLPIPRRLDGTVDWSRAFPAGLQDTARRRRRGVAVEYSPGYATRLTIHRVASFAMIPLFIGQYLTGNKIIDDPSLPDDHIARRLHKPLAIGTGVVFSVNTVTGLWNLIQSRKDPNGRTRRWIHGIGMLVADAGFAYTGLVLSDRAKEDPTQRDEHRAFALASMGVAVANWTFMLVTK